MLQSRTARLVRLSALVLYLALVGHTAVDADMIVKSRGNVIFSSKTMALCFGNDTYGEVTAPVKMIYSTSLEDVDLKGKIGILAFNGEAYSNAVDGFMQPTSNYQMMRQARKNGAIGLIFFQPNNFTCICCYETLLDEYHIPGASILASDATELFLRLNVTAYFVENMPANYSSAHLGADYDLPEEITVSFSVGYKSDWHAYFTSTEHVITYRVILTTIAIILILFAMHRIYAWLKYFDWNVKAAPMLALVTCCNEIICKLMLVIYFNLLSQPLYISFVVSFNYAAVPLVNLSCLLVAFFWFDTLNAVSIERVSFIFRFKKHLVVILFVLFILSCVMIPVYSIRFIVFILLTLFEVCLLCFYCRVAYQVISRLKETTQVAHTSLGGSQTEKGKLLRMTWNIIGVVFFGLSSIVFLIAVIPMYLNFDRIYLFFRLSAVVFLCESSLPSILHIFYPPHLSFVLSILSLHPSFIFFNALFASAL